MSVAPPRLREKRRFFAVIAAGDVIVVAALAFVWSLWPPAAVGAFSALPLVPALVRLGESA